MIRRLLIARRERRAIEAATRAMHLARRDRVLWIDPMLLMLALRNASPARAPSADGRRLGTEVGSATGGTGAGFSPGGRSR